MTEVLGHFLPNPVCGSRGKGDGEEEEGEGGRRRGGGMEGKSCGELAAKIQGTETMKSNSPHSAVLPLTAMRKTSW